MRFIYSKAFALFCVLLIAVCVVVFLEVKGLSGPIRSVFLNSPRPVIAAATAIARPVKGFFSTMYSLRGVVKENTQLRSEVYALQQQLVLYNQTVTENSALRAQLGFAADSPNQLISCAVLAQNPLGLSDSLILNCGTAQGVAQDLGVVSQGYLVGKVIYASTNSCTVLLITNSKFSVDARVSKTGDSGVVKGSFGSGIVLDQLSQNANINKDDLVATAGINGSVPKNLLIGQVGQILSTQNDLFKKVTVLSPIDFSGLQFVFVVK